MSRLRLREGKWLVQRHSWSSSRVCAHFWTVPAQSSQPPQRLQGLPSSSLRGMLHLTLPPSSILSRSLKKNTHTYFYTSFAAYIFGLGLTIFIMHIFKHAQVSGAALSVSGMLHAGNRAVIRGICRIQRWAVPMAVRASVSDSPPFTRGSCLCFRQHTRWW